MPPLSEATRPLMWNVSYGWVMYILFVAALAVFSWGMYQRVRFWRQGKEEKERFADWAKRFRVLFREIFLQSEKKLKNALMEALINLNKKILAKNFTKKLALGTIGSMEIDGRLLEKGAEEMRLEDFTELGERLRIFL